MTKRDPPHPDAPRPRRARPGVDLVVAALNGAIGDHLARTHNGLATEMAFVVDGAPIRPGALRARTPAAGPRIVVLVHGWMANVALWADKDGEDFGTHLAQDLGFTPLYVHYNSGRPIADNGADLSVRLDEVAAAWPDAELVLLGHSMGGLVIRAATHDASLRGAPWLAQVRHAIYVGTPHLGAPLERLGRVVTRVLRAVPDPITQLVGQIADLRSSGVKDLGDADLRHEDRSTQTFRLRDPRHPVPLLPGIAHHLIASAVVSDALGWFGDGVVPLESATGGDRLASPEAQVDVRRIPGVSHVAMASDPLVYAEIRAALGGSNA